MEYANNEISTMFTPKRSDGTDSIYQLLIKTGLDPETGYVNSNVRLAMVERNQNGLEGNAVSKKIDLYKLQIEAEQTNILMLHETVSKMVKAFPIFFIGQIPTKLEKVLEEEQNLQKKPF